MTSAAVAQFFVKYRAVRAYEKEGVEGLRNFGHEGGSCRLSEEQQTGLKVWVAKRLPRGTNLVGAWLEKNYGLRYSHAGLIALLHRLGFEYIARRAEYLVVSMKRASRHSSMATTSF